MKKQVKPKPVECWALVGKHTGEICVDSYSTDRLKPVLAGIMHRLYRVIRVRIVPITRRRKK